MGLNIALMESVVACMIQTVLLRMEEKEHVILIHIFVRGVLAEKILIAMLDIVVKQRLVLSL